jgi:DNA-binding NarL/FixJ family response regulator
MSINILIADDHQLFRGALASLIQAEPDLHIAALAADGEQTLLQLAAHWQDIDVILLDLSMPPPAGPELIRTLRQDYPELLILVLSMHNTPAMIRLSMEAGATAFFSKDVAPDQLLQALRAACSGTTTVSVPSMAHQPARAGADYSMLTARELEIVQRLAQGYQNKQVARLLGISEKTVSTHKTNLMAKLELANSAQLVEFLQAYPPPMA